MKTDCEQLYKIEPIKLKMAITGVLTGASFMLWIFDIDAPFPLVDVRFLIFLSGLAFLEASKSFSIYKDFIVVKILEVPICKMLRKNITQIMCVRRYEKGSKDDFSDILLIVTNNDLYNPYKESLTRYVLQHPWSAQMIELPTEKREKCIDLLDSNYIPVGISENH